MEQLRTDMRKCLMVFRTLPRVQRLREIEPRLGWSVWKIDVPLVLFPSRDRGFSLVEVAMRFQALLVLTARSCAWSHNTRSARSPRST